MDLPALLTGRISKVNDYDVNSEWWRIDTNFKQNKSSPEIHRIKQIRIIGHLMHFDLIKSSVIPKLN